MEEYPNSVYLLYWNFHFKFVNSLLLPPPFEYKFAFVKEIHNYLTHFTLAEDIILPKCQTKVLKRVIKRVILDPNYGTYCLLKFYEPPKVNIVSVLLDLAKLSQILLI